MRTAECDGIQLGAARWMTAACAGLITLAAGCGGSSIEVAGNSSDSPLVGQPAPAIELRNLAGQPVSLADHTGSDIVILDFWAEWCGPCRDAMPTIISVAEKYSSQGVVLYAVNLGDDPATIRRFLNDTGLEVDVLLDTEMSVAAAYGANAIPQTVIVDKDGTVQAVHVGLTPGLSAEISSQLETLIAGNKLAARAAPRAVVTR